MKRMVWICGGMRTWEFVNLFWFQMKGWSPKGLDCTHTGPSHEGISCLRRYFFMAMLDDHFDKEEGGL
jgi:hypothetical protein